MIEIIFQQSDSLMCYDDKLPFYVPNYSCLNEYRPIDDYHQKEFCIRLINLFSYAGICCAIVGTFPVYTAAVFCFYGIATLVIAKKDSHLMNEILLDKRLQIQASFVST
jgi:hypothetical protein